jgi:hypothetical protein
MCIRKKIFEQFRRFFTLRHITILCVFLGAAVLPAHATLIFHYKTHHPGTGEISSRFYCSLEQNLSGGYQAYWVINENGAKTEEDYVLNEYFETLRFRVVNIEEKTDYIGERADGSVLIRGRFKGSEIERTIPIDERPFYYNPKLGLMGFVKSGKTEERFWGFQNRELKIYPMKATRAGHEVISVDGKDVEAVKVYWTVDDFRSAFFKRTYWFRASDGLYVKQKTGDGKFRELIGEEEQGREDL